MEIDDVLSMIKGEHAYATSSFPPFNSAHEGLAVIQEEFEELKTEVFKKSKYRNDSEMEREALQIAAMAARFIIDVTRRKED